jgi:acetyl-CoA carboxylase carboxyltransferase component
MGIQGITSQHAAVGGGWNPQSADPIRRPPAHHWVNIDASRHRFLAPIREGLQTRNFRMWIDSRVTEASFDRQVCEGLVTAVADFHGRPVAIAWSDFRTAAAAYGAASSHRFSSFLRQLREAEGPPSPLIYFVNSAGVSLLEGRRIFSEAFALWPGLLEFASQHQLFTCAVGKCLGLAPLLFGLGHYRMAVAGKTQLNLTGPEVIAMFFGQRVEFCEYAAAERFHQRNDLIHELVPSVEAAFARIRGLLESPIDCLPGPRAQVGPTDALLASFLDRPPQELVPGWCDRVRLFIGRRRGRSIGLFVNPQERSDNLITVRTLEKYAAGLDLFRALGVPIISFLDSPGMDPRVDQSDANNFRKMLWVGEKIIRFPYGAMGVVTRRCFGGAATLAFPRVFGGRRVVVLRGSVVGTMHPSIIDRQLRGRPRLLAQWKSAAARQGPSMEDLLQQGSVDALIGAAELPREIDRFLAESGGASLFQGPRRRVV